MKAFTFELFPPFLLAFLVCRKCTAAESQLVDPSVSSKGGVTAQPILEQSENTNYKKVSKAHENIEQLVPFPIEEHVASDSDSYRTKPIEDSEIVLEGGDMSKLKSINTLSRPSNNKDGTAVVEDGNHSTGSKGRKGVHYPVSSVVPRKGVNQPEGVHSNSTNTNILVHNQIQDNATTEKTTTNSTEIKQSEDTIQQNLSSVKKIAAHSKKPEVVSDIGDIDDFDKYSIIKTSTTGEDYVIIGIVIVIGIWFSVFGALIFYRRAGEYWDRRHYRRMDFLVEGMYND